MSRNRDINRVSGKCADLWTRVAVQFFFLVDTTQTCCEHLHVQLECPAKDGGNRST